MGKPDRSAGRVAWWLTGGLGLALLWSALPASAVTTTNTGMHYARSGFSPASLSANLNRSLYLGDQTLGAMASVGVALNLAEQNKFDGATASALVTPTGTASARAWWALSNWGRLDCLVNVRPPLARVETNISGNCGASAWKNFGSHSSGSLNMNLGQSFSSAGSTNASGNASLYWIPAPERAPNFNLRLDGAYAMGSGSNTTGWSQWNTQVLATYDLKNGASLSSWGAFDASNAARSLGASLNWRPDAAITGRWQSSLSASLFRTHARRSSSNTQRLSLWLQPPPPAEPAGRPAQAPEPQLNLVFDLSRSVGRDQWGTSEDWRGVLRVERSFGFWHQQVTGHKAEDRRRKP